MNTATPSAKLKAWKSPPNVAFADRLSCTVAEAVAATGFSRSTLYNLMAVGKLQYRQHGSRRLIVVSSLRQLVGA
jgi:hypothetical protein